MRGRWLLAGVAASVALSAGAGLPAAGAGGRHAAPVRAAGSGLSAVIRRTEHGIPHIESSTFAGAGYGYGYAAGYNRYLGEVGGTTGVPDKTCRGKPWVRPITEMEAWRRLYQLILLASGDVAIDGIAEAQPPTPALGGGGAALDPQAIAEG